MKYLIFSVFLSLSSLSFGKTLLGQWKYSGIIYRGNFLPLPNPDLYLTWTFFENGTERLFWRYEGVSGFCERFAVYEIDNDFLIEKIFAVNPYNTSKCKNDPDMEVGREVKTKVEILSDEIRLHIPLGDQELVYVLKENF